MITNQRVRSRIYGQKTLRTTRKACLYQLCCASSSIARFKLDAEWKPGLRPGPYKKRHHHFIIVLNDAFRLPRPMISSGLQAARIGGKRFASDALGMENKFACLSLRDVAELADDEAGAVREEAVSSTSGAQEATGQC